MYMASLTPHSKERTSPVQDVYIFIIEKVDTEWSTYRCIDCGVRCKSIVLDIVIRTLKALIMMI